MKVTDFALFGAAPAFNEPLPVGQLYFPSWERYESAFKGIFERQYYTNQGPLVQELEIKLQEFLGVRNVIVVSNATIGLMITAESMGLTGKVILPAFTFIASAQSLTWVGLEPVFCDIDSSTHQIDVDKISSLVSNDVSGIMGVNLWGGACNPKAITELADSFGIQAYFDSAHSFGCVVDGVSVGNFGRAEVFSFHATKILSATEGGCICTNDDDLAARMRNIRSSYGAGRVVAVDKTANGRMSEAQAAVALMSLEDFSKNRENNEELYRIYAQQLLSVPGISLVKPAGVSLSNFQYAVYMIDEREFGLSRDTLFNLLKAEKIIARRYFYPGLHRTIPFVDECPDFRESLPNTDQVGTSCIQLPIGARVSVESIERICDIIQNAHNLSHEILSKYK